MLMTVALILPPRRARGCVVPGRRDRRELLRISNREARQRSSAAVTLAKARGHAPPRTYTGDPAQRLLQLRV